VRLVYVTRHASVKIDASRARRSGRSGGREGWFPASFVKVVVSAEPGVPSTPSKSEVEQETGDGGGAASELPELDGVESILDFYRYKEGDTLTWQGLSFEIGELLGSGSFADVFRARETSIDIEASCPLSTLYFGYAYVWRRVLIAARFNHAGSGSEMRELPCVDYERGRVACIS
jgi:hypothetical protein